MMLSAKACVTIAVLLQTALQPPVPNQGFKDWWARLTAGGASGPTIDGIMIEYSVERLSAPASQQSFRLWRMGTSWRWCRDDPGNPALRFSDQAWADGIAWALTPNGLHVADQATISSTPFRIDSGNSSIAFDVQLLFSAGICGAQANGIVLEPTLSAETAWRAAGDAQRSDGVKLKFVAEGHWQPESLTGTVDRTTFTVQPNDKPAETSTVEAAEWEFIPELQLAVAHSILITEPGLDRRLKLASHKAYTSREFAALTKLPGPATEDPIRGTPTFRSITDLRGGRPRVSEVDSQSRTKLTPLMPEKFEASNGTLRTLGWVLAAGLVTMIALLRYRSIHKSASR
jgi:hypothetical protein